MTRNDVGQLERQLQNARNQCQAGTAATYKVGEQVMLIKNLNQAMKLVNGTSGVVEHVIADRVKQKAEYDAWMARATPWQTGRMAAAAPVAAPVDVDDATAGADATDSVAEPPWPPPTSTPRAFTGTDDSVVFVRFENGLLVPLGYVRWELRRGKNLAAFYKMVPLIARYALTIHKSQSQTLPAAVISLERADQPGQAYVALSRVSTKEGTCVTAYRAGVIRADPRVVEYYKRLASRATAAVA
jgi:ATP-dependent DNA helicase PIF1